MSVSKIAQAEKKGFFLYLNTHGYLCSVFCGKINTSFSFEQPLSMYKRWDNTRNYCWYYDCVFHYLTSALTTSIVGLVRLGKKLYSFTRFFFSSSSGLNPYVTGCAMIGSSVCFVLGCISYLPFNWRGKVLCRYCMYGTLFFGLLYHYLVTRSSINHPDYSSLLS